MSNETLFTISSTNNQIATKPFEAREVKTKVVSAFALPEQKFSLTELEVMWRYSDGSLNLDPGDRILVNGQDARLPYGSTVWDNEGVKFILVPKDRIVLVKKNKTPESETTSQNQVRS